MLRFILIIIVLYVIISNPFLILVAGAAFLTWLYLKRPNSFVLFPRHLTTPGEEDHEPEDDLSRDKGFTTYKERSEREMSNIKFKKDFEKNPEWQKQAKAFRDHVQKARESEDAVMRAEGQNIKNWR